MKKHAIFRLGAWGILSATVLIHAQETMQPPVVTGYASYEAGQVVKGYGSDGEIKNAWIQKATIALGADAKVSSYLHLLVTGEANLTFSFKYNTQFIDQLRETQVPRTAFSLIRGEGLFSLLNDRLQIEAGFFPYRTSPDARNLGEFLFRSAVSPVYFANTFDRLNSDILGIRIGHTAGAVFHHDLLFNTEIYNYPMEDFSLSYIARYDIPRIIEVGGGVSLYRLLALKDYYTTPHQSANIRSLDNPRAVIDSITGLPVTVYDTSYYSFAGPKFMFRFAFDPKGLFNASIFGDEDLKLYAEAAMIGIERDSLYYDNPLSRLPIAVGFNIPAFRILDVLAAEMEYCDSPWPNSYKQGFEYGLPLPQKADMYALSRFKWSFYAKRHIGNNCWIIGQVARDHLIPLTHSFSMGVQDRTDVLVRITDWWWILKMKFAF